MIVRELGPSDAEGAVAVLTAVVPFLVTTPEAFRWQHDGREPEHQRAWVAVDGGAVVGLVRAGFAAPRLRRGFVVVFVHPAARGRGLGAQLFAAGEAYVHGLGATTVRGWVQNDPASMAFAERRGGARLSAVSFRVLDLAAFTATAEPPPGVEIRPGSAFADDPYPIYAVDLEAARDLPSHDVDDADYASWRANSWLRPDVDQGLASIVLVDGVVAAYTSTQTDRRDRYWSAMTGTLRAYRGRGLARLAKVDSLRRARAAGYRLAYTVNDDTNAPMIAVNEGLGYRPCATQWRYEKELA